MIMEREINLVCIGCSSLYHSPCFLSRYKLSISILLVTKNVFKTNDGPLDILGPSQYSNTFTHLLVLCCNIVNNTSIAHRICSYVLNARRKQRQRLSHIVHTRLCYCSEGTATFRLQTLCYRTDRILTVCRNSSLVPPMALFSKLFIDADSITASSY